LQLVPITVDVSLLIVTDNGDKLTANWEVKSNEKCGICC